MYTLRKLLTFTLRKHAFGHLILFLFLLYFCMFLNPYIKNISVYILLMYLKSLHISYKWPTPPESLSLTNISVALFIAILFYFGLYSEKNLKRTQE